VKKSGGMEVSGVRCQVSGKRSIETENNFAGKAIEPRPGLKDQVFYFE
jgi:hypothetical protein